MLLSLNWLRDFVPFEGSAQKLGDRLTMLGLELDDIIHPYANISKIVIGHVVTCEKHPESDHLSVCTVDAGVGEILNIVCGAPNVAAGQNVPVALVGTTMPNGLKIKKAKLRGVPSCGMICSERELELSDDHSGIMVLPENFQVGDRLIDALKLDEDVLDISITPNRADCLSILGLARETALAFHLPLTIPEYPFEDSGSDFGQEWTISVPQTEYCPFYQLRLVENVTIAPSPMWLRYRLNSVGVRAISNIVDITNLVLMELGQPLHAFDRDKLIGNKIEVSPAKAGEKITTLDGQERILIPGDILIRDAQRPVALAGVMGGLETEITETSKNVAIESAVFRPANIRRTARRLSLSSEASYRFERGVDQLGAVRAMNRAVSLMAQLGCGQIRHGSSTIETHPWIAPVPRFRPQRADALLGIRLDPAMSKDTLQRLGCQVDDTNKDDWKVTTPSWRHDLTREADLIEEVARVKGFESIPDTLPPIHREIDRFGLPESRFAFLSKLRSWGSGLGLNEVENYSFVGQKEMDRLGLPTHNRIGILNPLTEDQNVMRTELTPSLLQDVRNNMIHDSTGVRLFEIAHVFRLDSHSETTAQEEARLGIVLSGNLFDSAWMHKAKEASYTDLRGLVEHFCSFLHLSAPQFSTIKENDPLAKNHPYFLPLVQISLENDAIGFMGRVLPSIADFYEARKAVWIAEINLEKVIQYHLKAKIEAHLLPIFPAARRDMTVNAQASLSASQIKEEILHFNSPLLESVEMIDLYEQEDGRNLTFRLTFRKKDRTLKDNEADKEREKVAQFLIKTLGVHI